MPVSWRQREGNRDHIQIMQKAGGVTYPARGPGPWALLLTRCQGCVTLEECGGQEFDRVAGRTEGQNMTNSRGRSSWKDKDEGLFPKSAYFFSQNIHSVDCR